MRPRSMATKRSPRRSRCKCNRRRKKRARPSREAEPTPSGPTGVHHIPDHLLELVLLRVGTPVALLRAASTCKRWRRLIFTDDATHLSRFRRSLGAARIPGHYHVDDGNNAHVFVPDDSSADDALDRRHFSLDFLPAVPHGSLPWELADSRGGLLLFYRRDAVYYRMGMVWEGDPDYLHFPDMVVCDPLNRRCQGILYWEAMWSYRCLGLFLLDGADADEPAGGSSIGMSNFRVVAVIYESDVFEDDRGAPRACVFSSGGDGGWRQESTAGGDVPVPEYPSISFAGRARSSLFWRMEHEGVVLALDEDTIQFSLVTFPCTVVGTPEESSAFRVIGGGDGALRVVRVTANNDLTVFQRLQGSGEWVLEKLVRLPEATCGLPERQETYFQRPARIVATTTRHVLVTPQEETWVFSVDLETMEVDRAHERNRYAGAAYPFELPWPPALRVDDRRHRNRMKCIS